MQQNQSLKTAENSGLAKNKLDTGGGCSVCGGYPCKNVSGTYWLCEQCEIYFNEFELFPPEAGVDKGGAACIR